MSKPILRICRIDPMSKNDLGLRLCDAKGKPLPKQRSLYISTRYDKVPTVTVTFIIDGDEIVLE